jgi:predicted DNA repair protein MutK
MLWVGGHILLVGFDDLGWTLPYDLVHGAEGAVADATGPAGGVAGWLTNTLASALAGLAVGAAIVAVMHRIPRRGGDAAAP